MQERLESALGSVTSKDLLNAIQEVAEQTMEPLMAGIIDNIAAHERRITKLEGVSHYHTPEGFGHKVVEQPESDTQEQLAAAIRDFGNLDSNDWADAKGLADTLLDAMREVAREERPGPSRYAVLLDIIGEDQKRIAALEHRVESLEGFRKRKEPVIPDDEVKQPAPVSVDLNTQRIYMAHPAAPMPEPSEEAELLLDCLEEIDPDNSPWQGLQTHMDDLRYCQRIIEVINPLMERKAGKRMVKKFTEWLDTMIDVEDLKFSGPNGLAERFLKEYNHDKF